MAPRGPRTADGSRTRRDGTVQTNQIAEFRKKPGAAILEELRHPADTPLVPTTLKTAPRPHASLSGMSPSLAIEKRRKHPRSNFKTHSPVRQASQGSF